MHKGNLTDLFNYLEKRGKRQVLQSEATGGFSWCSSMFDLSFAEMTENKLEQKRRLVETADPFGPTARKKSFQVSEIVRKTSVAIHLTHAVESTV